MFDGIEYRGFSQVAVTDLAEYSGVPVWNGLTDQWHPTQMLADFLTIKEHFGTLDNLTLAYVGDGRNNVANSLLVTGAILGVNIHVVAPESLFPDQEILALAQEYAKASGGELVLTSSVAEGVKGADILYTDVWVSMGEEAKAKERLELLMPYQVNEDMVAATENKDVIFLHCLPAFHDQETLFAQQMAAEFGIKELEVTDAVFQAPYAKQFQQAENRMHTIKAVMAATLGNLFIPRV